MIFDLDGTLVQSLPGIEESARVAISRVMPEAALPDLRPLMGPPVAQMFAAIWPTLPSERMLLLLAEFRAHYDTQGCLRSEPYPHVPEVLLRLHQSGIRLFVLTNKPVTPARKVLAHLGLADLFTDIIGPDSLQPPFQRKLDGARMLAQKHRLTSGSTLLVGDGVDDAESATACGFGFIAVNYGYGRAADEASVTVKQFSEIEHLLLDSSW